MPSYDLTVSGLSSQFSAGIRFQTQDVQCNSLVLVQIIIRQPENNDQSSNINAQGSRLNPQGSRLNAQCSTLKFQFLGLGNSV